MKKSRLILSLTAILCATVLAVSFVFAWFISSKVNKTSVTNVKVGSGANMEVSIDGVNFSRTLDLDFEGLELIDITGDGKTFFRPTFTLEDGVTEHGITYNEALSAVPATDVRWATPNAAAPGAEEYDSDDMYIQFDLWFRSAVGLGVYLCGDSTILPSSETITGSSAGNLSPRGPFSKDCIAGAARLAIAEGGDTKIVWVPNTEYELSYSDGSWLFNPEGTPESEAGGYYYYAMDDSGEYAAQDLADINGGTGVYIGTLPEMTYRSSASTIPDDAVMLVELEQTEESGEFFVGKITITIWIEGCDREARAALAGGNIDVLLNFMGYNF